MKKVFNILYILLILLIMFGCNNDDRKEYELTPYEITSEYTYTENDDFYVEIDINIGSVIHPDDGDNPSLQYIVSIIAKDISKTYEDVVSSVTFDETIKGYLTVFTVTNCASYVTKEEQGISLGKGYRIKELEYGCVSWIEKEAVTDNFEKLFKEDIKVEIEWSNGEVEFFFPIDKVKIQNFKENNA